MAKVLKGAPVAAALTETLAVRAANLKERGIIPTLGILRVGNRGDDIAYERGAMNRCEKIGIAVKQFLLPAKCTQRQLIESIEQINEDTTIHGCLMFRPLENRKMEAEACTLLAPEKDVDCMTASALSGVFSGNKQGFTPCTAQACIEILDYYGINCEGKRAVVIGRSLVIGKSVSMMLLEKNATVTICHTKTSDISSVCREADILIAAAGKAKMVNFAYTNSGQIVIDVGINVDAMGNICGDVNFAEVEPLVSAITPTPGGVGAVTTTVLAKHVIESAEKY